MGIKIDNSGLVKVVALLLLVVIPAVAFWSWMPDASKEWLAVIGVVGVFWVIWEACGAQAGEDRTEN